MVTENPGDRIVELIREKMKQDPDLTWNEASYRVSKENPDLVDCYLVMGRNTAIFPNEEDPELEFLKLIGKKMEGDPSLSYGKAMNLVARENPELLKRYIAGARENKVPR